MLESSPGVHPTIVPSTAVSLDSSLAGENTEEHGRSGRFALYWKTTTVIPQELRDF